MYQCMPNWWRVVQGGLVDGLTKMAAKEGISSWFHGVEAVVPWGALYYGSQFFTYDLIKRNYATYGMPPGEKREMTPMVTPHYPKCTLFVC